MLVSTWCETLTYGWMRSHVMASDMTWDYVKGEWQELLAEVRAGNLTGIREEWSDVTCCTGLYLAARGWLPGWMPILPGLGLYAARKFIGRRTVWARIFAHHGISFHRRFLVGGGNYAKLRKVKAALGLAGVSAVDAEWLRGEGIVTEE